MSPQITGFGFSINFLNILSRISFGAFMYTIKDFSVCLRAFSLCINKTSRGIYCSVARIPFSSSSTISSFPFSVLRYSAVYEKIALHVDIPIHSARPLFHFYFDRFRFSLFSDSSIAIHVLNLFSVNFRPMTFPMSDMPIKLKQVDVV